MKKGSAIRGIGQKILLYIPSADQILHQVPVFLFCYLMLMIKTLLQGLVKVGGQNNRYVILTCLNLRIVLHVS